MGLGLFTQARPLIDGAVAKRRRLPGIDPLDLSDSLSHQGDLMALQADYEAGEKAYREAIRIESARPTIGEARKTCEFALRLGHVARQGRDAMGRRGEFARDLGAAEGAVWRYPPRGRAHAEGSGPGRRRRRRSQRRDSADAAGGGHAARAARQRAASGSGRSAQRHGPAAIRKGRFERGREVLPGIAGDEPAAARRQASRKSPTGSKMLP